MLLNSLFDPEEIDRERGTVIEEINMYNDDPASYVRNLSPQLLWPNHPLGHDTLGTKEIIDTISRDDIVAYKNKHYSPENMVVVAAGAAKHDEVVKLASKFLGDIKRQEVIKPLPVPPSISPKMVETKEKDTAQTHMVIAARSYAPKHANHQAANILAAILGRGLSSRLFLNVRERKGLAYAINASNQTYADAGEFEIYAGVNNEKVADAIEAILEELEEIRTNKVPETELSKAKNQLAGGLRMSLESNNAVANRLGAELILLKEVRDIEDVIDDINAVTAEDVTRVAKEILDPKLLRMAVISAHPDVAQKAFERKVKGR
jgi:predicted Zn-dependent peptidase